jgi:hypothetical protein
LPHWEQLAMLDPPVVARKVPAKQDMHAAEFSKPVPVEYIPAGQPVQLSSPE